MIGVLRTVVKTACWARPNGPRTWKPIAVPSLTAGLIAERPAGGEGNGAFCAVWKPDSEQAGLRRLNSTIRTRDFKFD